jgi:hypothetical protein
MLTHQNSQSSGIKMRNLLMAAGLIISGCAGQQSAPPLVASTTYVSASGETLATAPVRADGTLDAKRLADAKRAGYSLVNTNGEVLYCRTEAKIGSRIQKNSDTTCLTAAQLDAQQAANRNTFQNLPGAQSATPPRGHN